MNPVAPADYGLLLIHINPHVNFGTATVRYAVWDITNPTLKDTLTYILHVNNTTGINEAENKKTLLLFPDPVADVLNINFSDNNQHSIAIYNALGKKIYSSVSTSILKFETLNLSNGVYHLSVLENNTIITTKSFIILH